jgi:cytochrome oxidase assembly protein ShyY1
MVAHLLVLIIAGLFLRLGAWQLDRLNERRELNATVEERRAAPPGEFDQIVGQFGMDELEYRSASLRGTFDPTEEVLIRSRTSNGEAGFHVITPLVTSSGNAVLINRGWVPLSLDTPQAPEARPPTGSVQLIGTIRVSESAPSLGPEDPADGVLERMYWIDIPRIQQQSVYRLASVFVEMAEQTPFQSSGIPVPVESGDLSEGSHLAYAVQWFGFALIGTVGYIALLRRSAGRPGGRSAVRENGQPSDDLRTG